MTGATTWHGRRGTVILGPTEHRVARWLAGMTRTGRVTLRTVDLAAATGVERSEAYRITARLRVLGLFGIENDRGGNHHGRRYWRTATNRTPARSTPAVTAKRGPGSSRGPGPGAIGQLLAWPRSAATTHGAIGLLHGDQPRLRRPRVPHAPRPA
jgi:hypothetical protein